MTTPSEPVLSAPLAIGPLTLESPLVLAPLAGYTDLAFRLLCREAGAGMCFSEMISCHGLSYGQQNTLVMMQTVAAERPVGIQLFGNDPETMGRAAAITSTYPVDLIDINMGCPVRKVIKKGSGAALMKDPALAEKIIKKVVASTHLPVTVKFRSGWSHATINAPEFAQMAEGAGVSAVILHARTWTQAFGGDADWKIIARVKEAVNIPVIGNGDILSFQDGRRMRAETGCDGVMVGRGALGNPWVFSEAGRPGNLTARLPLFHRYLELAQRYLPVERMLFRIKNHASRYLAGLPGASQIRQEILACHDVAELREVVAAGALLTR